MVCSYVFARGCRKGMKCGKDTMSDTVFCKPCSKKKVNKKIASRTGFCEYINTRGARKGMKCGKPRYTPIAFCKSCVGKKNIS